MDRLNSKMEESEERIGELEYKTIEIIPLEQQRKSSLKNKHPVAMTK